ncbi:MAG: phosphoglucosamine mutase [Patescibacteria group bacterium]
MPLIKSISGIRGLIGGRPGDNLTPVDVVHFIAAYAEILKQDNPANPIKVIIGRDSRISGEMIKNLVAGTLLGQGIDVVDIGLASAPTVEMAVISAKAQGGIILTASHNPQGWNALKLLNPNSEIFSAAQGQKVLDLVKQTDFTFVTEDKLGHYISDTALAAKHLDAALGLPLVDREAIAARKFKVVVDGINSVGGLIVPELLRRLGVADIIELNCEPTGQFAHRPEPLAENLTETCRLVKETQADFGIVVDPDVDRLAFINEQGEMISEEYTLVAVADYILNNFSIIEKVYPGQYEKTTTSNLSSSRALKDVAEKHGGHYELAAVGEINVVEKMKEQRSVIGGEGNGGVIYAPLHYGRDALVGIVFFLSALARSQKKISEFKRQLPEYFMVKDKITLSPGLDLPKILSEVRDEYAGEKITDIDGLRIDWTDSWIHLRASNTEPIIRVYAEAKTLALAASTAEMFKNKILAYIK